MFSYMKRGLAFYQDVGRLSLPIILQNIVAFSLALADNLMVGLLPGDLPMAAVTLANIPIFVMQLMIFGLQSGASVLISQFWGKGDKDSINRVLGIGLYVAGAVSAVFAAVMFFFPAEFLGLFTNNGALIPLAVEYARPAGLSYFFGSLTQIYIAAHRSMENPKLGMYVLSFSMVLDTFLNWVLIFGKLGFPAMGVAGASVSTLYSRMLEFLIIVVYAARSHRFPLRLDLILRPGRVLLGKFLRFSAPVLLNETLWGLGTGLYATVMGYMAGSAEILAAHSISGNLMKLSTVVVFALGGTAAVIIGREIGAGRDTAEVYDIGRALNMLSLLAGVLVGAVMVIATYAFINPFFFPIFDLSPSARQIAGMMLVVSFITLPVRAFNANNIVGVLRGGGDVHMASLIDTVPLWLVALPLAALVGLVFRLDILWVTIAFSMENVVKFFWGVRRFRTGLWIHDLTQISQA